MAKELHKLDLDLYSILGVDETASEKQIVKGYRKKALKCHPDKNPDNPKAAQEFHQLSEALEILTDVAARAAYDRSRKAKKETEARNKALDSKRKKFKEDLEAREQAAEEKLNARKTAAEEKNLQREIERLRREGSKLLEQEQERLRQELKASTLIKEPETKHTDVARIKLKWKATKGDLNNGGYDECTLSNILSCYGHINTLIVSSKRCGSAIVEFESSGVSSDILEEKGLSENPFTIVWLSGKPLDNLAKGNLDGNVLEPSSFRDLQYGVDKTPVSADPPSVSFSNRNLEQSYGGTGSETSTKDFESLVLMKMRQAEERKKLIEQMQKEDGNG